jgi:hypothetical protein
LRESLNSKFLPTSPIRLVVRSLGFTTKTIELSALPEGTTKEINFDLSEEVKENKEVVITVKRRADTDVSLITDMRKPKWSLMEFRLSKSFAVRTEMPLRSWPGFPV